MSVSVADRNLPGMSLREAQRAMTRQRISQAAARLFYEQGFSAVTMEEIAQSAGVSRSTLYLHYPDKTDLPVAIATAFADALCALVARLPGPVPSRAEIEAWMHDLAVVVTAEKIPAALINDLTVRGEAPEAVALIGGQLLVALAARLPAFDRTLRCAETHALARAWAEAAMREIGWACSRIANEPEDRRSARLAVAADIFERFVQAQLEMER